MIVGFMFSMVVSVSYSSYKKYKYYYDLTALVSKLKEARRESFLYSKVIKIFTKDGVVFIQDRQINIYGCSLNIEGSNEITFTKTGSEGGVIKAICDRYIYMIKIIPPYGELFLEWITKLFWW